MLSISNVANGEQASQYYEQADDYYTGDRSPSQWSGQAAAALGLAGEVKAEDFRALLDGRLPNGVELHRGGENGGRRGGTDLTFSAPKSVSMQLLVAGDARLLAAHETAVARALEQVEALAACRVTARGLTLRVPTGALAVAQFRHDLSRAADPQLHTHCVVLNLTQRSDGAWRALNNEDFYRHKMWLGAFYRSELAREVQALGYALRTTHADGRFELAHIAPEQIGRFSSRSKAIEQALQAKGLSREQASARQLQTAALQTREAKQVHDRADLREQWRERAAQAGIRWDAGVAPVQRDAHQEAVRAVRYATAHLGEREAVFKRLDLERVALERGTGHTQLGPIRAAIEQAVQDGELLRERAGEGMSATERYTTPAAVQREREILALEAAGRGQVAPLMRRQAVQLALLASSLNEGQRGVVEHVLAGENRISGVQGSAGTGKTTALRAVGELAQGCGLKLAGVAPSASAARELGGSGIDSQTVASLLARGCAGLDAQTLLVVDEAGMISARDMHTLLTAAVERDARVLLVGDTQQLKAVAAGKPFAQLQDAGMACAQLRQIQRQQNPKLKAAVELAAAGDAAGSLQELKEKIVVIEPRVQRHHQIASDYAALTPEQRAATLIVAGTHLSREAINGQVRQALGLAGQGQTVCTLSGKNLTQAEVLRSVSYQAGDVVRAEREYKTLGLRRGEFATVVDGPPGLVMLQRADGQQVAWRPVSQPNFTAYHAHERELAVGDVVRLTSNDYRAGFINGERATVIALQEGQLQLQKADGQRLSLRSDAPLYLEHGYCQTVHAAQGQTCDRVLIEAPADHGSASSHYVGISRPRHELRIYTDDAQLLPHVLGREDDKTAALELQCTDEKGARRRPTKEMELA
jgi:conjugative relaxase-like TrwC/TraI family protein